MSINDTGGRVVKGVVAVRDEGVVAFAGRLWRRMSDC
jgi:hypothetical protein